MVLEQLTSTYCIHDKIDTAAGKFIGIYEASSVVFFFPSPLIFAYHSIILHCFAPSNENIQAIELYIGLMAHDNQTYAPISLIHLQARPPKIHNKSRWIGY